MSYSYNVPNLDAATVADLEKLEDAYWFLADQAEQHAMLDNADMYCTLASYCHKKICARHARVGGNISAATYYEELCEALYSKLPKGARW